MQGAETTGEGARRPCHHPQPQEFFLSHLSQERAQEGARVTVLWCGSDVASAAALTDAPPPNTQLLTELPESGKGITDTQISIPQVSTDHRYPEIHVDLYFKNWGTLSLGVLVLVTTILTFVFLYSHREPHSTVKQLG